MREDTKETLIITVVLILVLGVIFTLTEAKQPSSSAQIVINRIIAERKENDRLQIQGEIREPGTYRILAICDVGNGTMIYSGVWYSGPTSLEIVQGGCAKAKAEK